MVFELLLLGAYRILTLIVAIMMVVVVLRDRNWQHQVFAAMLLVPFALRAAGVK